jgi:hypothetical protein
MFTKIQRHIAQRNIRRLAAKIDRLNDADAQRLLAQSKKLGDWMQTELQQREKVQAAARRALTKRHAARAGMRQKSSSLDERGATAEAASAKQTKKRKYDYWD